MALIVPFTQNVSGATVYVNVDQIQQITPAMGHAQIWFGAEAKCEVAETPEQVAAKIHAVQQRERTAISRSNPPTPVRN